MADFIPPLARWFDLTTRYGAPTAAGPHAGEPHTALDFGAPFGEPVFAMRDGTVLAPDANPEGVTGGNTITIDYGDGIIATIAHLSGMLVNPGDRVKRGDPIGFVGNSGITTGDPNDPESGAHLHLDTWRNGIKINPLDLFDWTGVSDIPVGEYGGEEVKEIIEDFGQYLDGIKTWGDLANAPFLGQASGQLPARYPTLGKTVDDLGWKNRVARASDLPEFALRYVGIESRGGNMPWDVAGDVAATVGDFVGAVLNPLTWARVAAMLLGFAMALFGAYMIWTATA
jgi:hypothetical protein